MDQDIEIELPDRLLYHCVNCGAAALEPTDRCAVCGEPRVPSGAADVVSDRTTGAEGRWRVWVRRPDGTWEEKRGGDR
jgi:hypothetical protein